MRILGNSQSDKGDKQKEKIYTSSESAIPAPINYGSGLVLLNLLIFQDK